MKNKFLTKLLCFIISIMMIVPIGISLVAAADGEDPFTALADYGVYSYAGLSGDTTKSLVIDHGASNKFKLFSIDTQAQQALAAGIGQTELDNAKTLGYKYISGVDNGVSDGAIQYQSKTSVDSVTKDVYFSTRYLRGNPGGSESAGYIYFTVQSNNSITAADTNLTILVEYLDTADVSFGLLYYSTAGNKGHSQTITAGGTNKWKIAQFDVADAKFSSGEKTALGSTQKCDFRIQANKKDTYVSRVMVVKTSDYEAYLDGTLDDGSQDGGNDDNNDDNQQPGGIDFELLKEYSLYVDADADEAKNLQVYSKPKGDVSDTYIYDKTINDEKSVIDTKAQTDTNLKANLDANSNVNYVCLGSNDSSWRYKLGTDGTTAKNTMFTTRYVWNRTGNYPPLMGGSLYFKATDVLTESDNKLTFIVEYLDKGTTDLVIEYVDTDFVDGSATASTEKALLPRTDTGNWVTNAVSVTNANLAVGLTKTELADKLQTIKVHSSNVDTYISKFLIIKTSDYEKYLAGELEQTDDVVVANAKSALKLDVTEAKGNFTLPTSDADVRVMWSSNNAAIAVDGNNAVVTQGVADAVVTLTATITKNDAYATKTFTVIVPAKYKKAAGTEIIIGESTDDDVIEGEIYFDTINTLFERTEPETATGKNLMYESPQAADYDSMRILAGPEGDKRWAAFTTTFYRPSRENSVYTGGNISFNVEQFTKDDKKLTIEIDYLDNGTAPLTFTYVNGPDPDNKQGGEIPTIGTKSVTRGNTGEWKTVTIEASDAYFDNAQYTNRGASIKGDIRVDGTDMYISRVKVYMGAYDELKSAVEKLTLDEVYDDNGISVANGYVETDFILPDAIDGVDEAQVTWESADDSIIAIDDNVAKINPIEDMELKVTLTATIVVGESYAQKSFDITLYKKPKQVVKCSQPVITGAGTASATASIDVTSAGKLIGEDITLILASVDSTSGEIKKIGIQTQKVEEEKFTISATVDNTSGELKPYLVDKNGVPLYNAAPSPIKNYRVVSGTSGINVMWDAAADDYNAIKKYVIYDGEGNKVDELSGDKTSYFVPVKAGETKSYAVEGFDHYGISTGKTEVCSGSLFVAEGITVKLYDLNGEGSNSNMFNDYISNPNTDNHTHEKAMTDTKTGETLVCRHTLNRASAGLCACGNDCTRTGYTFAYFKPDGTYVTKNTKEVAVIVKYFDYGKGTVNVQYNTVEDYEKTEAKVEGKNWQGGGSYSFELTGTNTFKTHVIKITDACFFSPDTLSKADMRFSTRVNGGEFYIAELTMMPLENYFSKGDGPFLSTF